MNFDKYLFRCHMVGKIIDVPKPLTDNQRETYNEFLERSNGIGRELTKNQKDTLTSLQYKKNESEIYRLNDGTKKLLSRLAYAEKYGLKIDINSPKIKKGLEVEKNSRDILTRVSGTFFTANDERKYNDFVTGEIDIKPNNTIIDIKSSWSWESYSTILEESANELYLRQGDSYMDLWGIDNFLLCHILTDTPAYLVDSELRKADYNKNILDCDGNVRDENIIDVVKIVSNLIFSEKALKEYCYTSSIVEMSWFKDWKEIPENERVHMIEHKFDKERIEQRNECIILAREYMNSVKSLNNLK